MRFGFLLSTALLLVLTGCSDIPVPGPKPATGRNPTVAEVPNPEETVRGAEDPPVVTLELGSRLRERRLTRTEELPATIIIPNTNLNSVPVTSALEAVLSGTDVSLSWEAGSFENKLVTVTNLSGPLPKVVEKICASAKVFCGYRGGLLEIKEKETFIIELPSVPTKTSATGAATNTMADTIGELAGDKVRIDQQGGNLLYATNYDGHEQVKEYLTQLRHGRPLVVMQLYIWEVVLDSDHGAGINWKNIKLDKMANSAQSLLLDGTTAFSSIASPGVSLGAKFAGKLDVDTVMQFLSTQGQVQTISNPQLTFVSGSNAEFRVGGKQRYISQVGSSGSVSGSTSTTSSSNTVSTDSLDTGLKVNIGGAFESGIISAMLELELQDVIALNPTAMENGTIVDLPETSERKVSTSLRVRPGDNLVLAGLVTSRDTNDRDKLPLPFGLSMNTFQRDQLKNSELVILVKPSIVLFADNQEKAAPPAKKTKKAEKADVRSESDAQEQSVASAPLDQDAVVIDKDGTRTVALAPSGAPLPAKEEPFFPVIRPELMVPASQAGGTWPPSSTIAASADGAPVDKRLMQRGFSRAFDELLAPDGAATASASSVRSMDGGTP